MINTKDAVLVIGAVLVVLDYLIQNDPKYAVILTAIFLFIHALVPQAPVPATTSASG